MAYMLHREIYVEYQNDGEDKALLFVKNKKTKSSIQKVLKHCNRSEKQ